MTQTGRETINYKDELVRKLIHLCSLSIPIIVYFIPRTISIAILSCFAAAAIVLDLSRYMHPRVGKVFYSIFGFLLRKHEVDNKKKNLNGATYVFISALICVIIFPKILFLTGIYNINYQRLFGCTYR